METTPHRLYMSLIGVLLGVCGALLCAIVAMLLHLGTARLRQLLVGMPAWLHELIPNRRVTVPEGAILQTAGLLVLVQMALYVTQENLESLSVGAGLPGLGVLLAPQHATVIPLHLLLAGITSFLLCAVASWLATLRAAIVTAEALVRLARRWTVPPSVPPPVSCAVVRFPLAASRRSLRSPPLPI